MSDGPSSAAAFALGHSRCASRDEARMAELNARIAAERDVAVMEAARLERLRKAAELEGGRQAQRELEQATVPHWPSWALHPAHAKPGYCGTCPRPLGGTDGTLRGRKSATGLCWRCGKRAGRFLPRVALALRLFREGKWAP